MHAAAQQPARPLVALQRKKKIVTGQGDNDFIVVTVEVGLDRAGIAMSTLVARCGTPTRAAHLPIHSQAPIHYSQVSLVEPLASRQAAGDAASSNTEATAAADLVEPAKRWVRAKFRFLADGTRVRVGKGPHASGALIPIPPQPNTEPAKIGRGAQGWMTASAASSYQDVQWLCGAIGVFV